MKKALKLEQPKFLTLDLQFFSEEHPFAAESVAPEPHPFAAEPDNSMFAKFADAPNPLLAPDVPLETQVHSQDQGLEVPGEQLLPGGEPIPEEQFLDFSGRQVKVIDPVINDLHKDYTNLNKTYQQTSQELQQYKQTVADYQSRMQEQTAAHPAQPTQTQGMTPERRAEINETYMEMQYSDKIGADEWLASQPEIVAANNQRLQSEIDARVNEIVGPIQQERQLQEEVTKMHSQFADFESVTPQIQALLASNPALADMPNALENMYYMAKGQAAHSAPPVPTFESMMQDPTNQANIVQNEQIQKMVMENYQKSKLQQTQQIPTVMGNNAGARTPMSAGERTPQTMQEATAAFLRYQGQQ